MSAFNINIVSTTVYNGKYAYYLGILYGYVYWNSSLNRWENSSNLGVGTLYNYLLSTSSTPVTTITEQWVNVVPGFEFYLVSEGQCITPNCYCHKLTASEFIVESTYSYISCEAQVISDQPILQSEIIYICARQGSVVVNPLEITVENEEVDCVNNGDCEPATTTTTLIPG